MPVCGCSMRRIINLNSNECCLKSKPCLKGNDYEVIAKVTKSINCHFDQREKSFDINTP